MNRNATAIAVAATACVWVPYLALKCYWSYLINTVPGAEHGEVSGPVLYFLPRLLAVAVLSTLLIGVTCLVLRSRTPRQK